MDPYRVAFARDVLIAAGMLDTYIKTIGRTSSKKRSIGERLSWPKTFKSQEISRLLTCCDQWFLENPFEQPGKRFSSDSAAKPLIWAQMLSRVSTSGEFFVRFCHQLSHSKQLRFLQRQNELSHYWFSVASSTGSVKFNNWRLSRTDLFRFMESWPGSIFDIIHASW